MLIFYWFYFYFQDIVLLEKVQVGNASMIYKGEWKGKTVAVKKYFTYKIEKLQAQATKTFEYERNMMEYVCLFTSPLLMMNYDSYW